MGTPDEKPLEVAALGRSFDLGMLYDCRSDFLIHGRTLWGKDELQNNIRTVDKSYSSSEVTISDTHKAKSHALNISAELKVS